jgi:MFS superfamily sulfate permease-like transporter
MKTTNNISATPKTGFQGLIQNWKSDSMSGFMVFLLALPLSLGIAKASGFPASMGVLSAIIGGLFTTFFKVSELSIKGPAAGLITICAGAILEFGGGDTGWHVAAAAIMVAALIQILFSILKFGSLSDFFPHSAVHGMLAAIGIIIIAKQIPVLLGDDPSIYKGEGPIELIMDIPNFISHSHWHIAIVGILGLLIMFGLPKIGISFIKKIPAPTVVLILTIPLSLYWHFGETEPGYSLVSIGDFWGSLGFNFNFSYINSFAFWKYVFMFLFVNSLESLLTVKAVDNLDPYKRTSSYNGDLMGIGAGNFLSGMLGGLPMISEVVRSSANVGFGAKTKWSNFFHGLFLLLSMILLIPFIELIPNAALAAMLIYAGYRLAAPNQFIHVYKIGKEQLAIFLTTIIVTLVEDLLLGILAGILVKFLFHLYNGASFKSLFKAQYTIQSTNTLTTITLEGSALFSNLIGFKKVLQELPQNNHIRIDFSKTHLIDHSFISFLTHFQNEYNFNGGQFEISGLQFHKKLSDHELATRKLMKTKK